MYGPKLFQPYRDEKKFGLLGGGRIGGGGNKIFKMKYLRMVVIAFNHDLKYT